MNRVNKWLIASLIFLTPTNLFLKLAETEGYVNGLLIDYLIPKLYLSDLVILGLLSAWVVINFSKLKALISKKLNLRRLKANWLLILISFVFLLRQFLTIKPLASLSFTWHLLLSLGLAIFLANNKKLLKSKLISWSFFVTLTFQSLVGLFQFITQKSLAGYLLLGEPSLTNFFILNRGQILGSEKILPYGTTAHPNLLAGTLVIYWLILFKQKNVGKNFKMIFWSLTPVFALVLFLTQSITAWLVLVIGLSLSWIKPGKLNKNFKLRLFFGSLILTVPIILFLTSFQSQAPSFYRRANLIKASWQVIAHNPVWGVGLNQFTAVLQDFVVNQEIIRFIQPVHHLGLLFLAEGGLLGCCLLMLVWIKLGFKKQQIPLALIILLPIISLDHYLLTLQPGRLLFIWSLFFFGHGWLNHRGG